MSTRSTSEAGADIRVPGVARGIVTDLSDPDREGRIRVRYPWLDNQMMSNWASIAAPMAGNGRGLFAMPELEDEVVLGFDRGRANHPIVLGFTWNGQDAPPDQDTRVRTWQSTNGHAFMMVDSTPEAGSTGAVVIVDGHGNSITMGNGVITISAKGLLRLKAPAITLDVGGTQRIVTPSPKPI